MRFIISAALLLSMAAVLGIPLPASADDSKDAVRSQERSYSQVEIRSDFEAMYRGLQSAHFDLYAFTPKTKLDYLYHETLAGLDRPMTLFEVKTRFELFAAAVHMGHTRVDSPSADWARYLKDGGKAFPLNIDVLDDKAYVAENLSGVEAIQRGDEIVQLDSILMPTWLERTERHASAETAYMAHSLLDYDFPMYVWIELGNIDSFHITLRKPTGSTVSVVVPARTDAEMKAFGTAQPPVLDLENPLRDARILPKGVGYLRPGPFYNVDAKTAADEWDVSGFSKFIDESFKKFNAAGVHRLVIDLRGNPGGDNLFSDVMVSWFADRPFRFFSQFKVRVSTESIAANQARIEHDAVAAGPVSRQYAELYAHAHPGDIVDFEVPFAQPRHGQRFDGKVFLLVDRHSYSNSVAVAALVQDYKFGVILGEPTSDMATTYGAMEQFKLPNTGIYVGYPKARIVRPSGDLRSLGVTPDISIPVPVVQTPADEVLQKAVEIAAQGS